MKIAILGPAPPFRGGISRFALSLARAFKDTGHNVQFFNFREQYPKLLFPGKGQYDSELPTNEFVNHQILTPWLPKTWKATIHELKIYRPEAIIVSWFLPYFAPAYGYILRQITCSRKVILAHNIASHEKWLGEKYFLQYAFKPATKIVTLSKATLDELHRKLPLYISKKGVSGFHPCYDMYNDNISATRKDNTLFFFGLIKPYKGLDILLQAMPKVIEAFPDVKLIIAGEVYGNKNIYTEQIQALGIENNVECYFRYLGDPEISYFFNQSCLCILPYKSASQSGVIATSYSFGVPVLATKVGGLGEYVIEGKTGYLVPPDNPSALAEAIINHLQQKPNMSQAINEYTKHYSWKGLAELLIK